MDYVFARHGVDKMLERGEIDFMVLSHRHLDHFWGIELTLTQPADQDRRRPTWRAEDWIRLTYTGNDRGGGIAVAAPSRSARIPFPMRAN